MAHASQQPIGRLPARITLPAQPRAANPRPLGFNFTHHVRLVCQDMVERLAELRHIDFSRVAVGFCQARKAVPHGLQAALTPMRFEEGRQVTIRNGRQYRVQQLVDERGNEFLYLLTFYLPRFLNLPFREKLVTILHELWHISPRFDGDLRRHEGRCYIHTRSEREYNAAMGKLADQWLAQNPPDDLYRFLDLSFAALCAHHGRVYGARIPAPKLIPLTNAASRRH
jgi:hypothetical protein